ncbi:DUF1266 domain-containing protein [Rapidithrix thailandica]|uniref:DUF1266 domain-containing protein n=1 Tax=Rapidithrix thailandica TaxID=413964 RepID=A0AAW9SAF1_9BACT
MNTNTYYIISAIAIAFIVYLLRLNQMMKKRKAKQIDDFKQRFSGKPLNPNQKKALAYGAILAYTRSEDILSLIPNSRLDKYEYGLKEQWGITNTKEALEVLNGLVRLERSQEYDQLLLHCKEHQGLRTVFVEIAKGLELPVENVRKIASTYAWDICRAVNLAKWCFWLGYLTEEQTNDYLNKCVEVVWSKGKSWQEYTCSFLIGRAIQGFDLDELLVECQQLLSGQLKKCSVYIDLPFK